MLHISKNRKVLPAFVGACFFISGAAGLVYEVLWVRMIDKVIGSAPFAVATVLTVFMAGLALGSYLAGRSIDRFTSRSALLALYGKLEAGIGACALAVPFGIQATRPVYEVLYNRLLEHFWCCQVAAFFGCALVLVAPAALMGATLPVLCRYYVLRHDHIGVRTGWLYGLNTVGAALGVILCGFVLIHTYQDKFAHMILAQALLLFAVLLAPTLFSGAAFPLVNKLYSRSMDTMGRSLGRVVSRFQCHRTRPGTTAAWSIRAPA
jgi:MFS family permease